jgi:hypothetical protein
MGRANRLEGDAVKLCIQEIKPCAKATYLALMMLGHKEIRTEIVELEHGAVRGFHLKDPLFKDLLSVCGLAKQFSQDFWIYRDGQAAAFPWDYGEQDDQQIALTLQYYQKV